MAGGWKGRMPPWRHTLAAWDAAWRRLKRFWFARKTWQMRRLGRLFHAINVFPTWTLQGTTKHVEDVRCFPCIYHVFTWKFVWDLWHLCPFARPHETTCSHDMPWLRFLNGFMATWPSDIQWHPVTSSDIQWHPVTSSDILMSVSCRILSRTMAWKALRLQHQHLLNRRNPAAGSVEICGDGTGTLQNHG